MRRRESLVLCKSFNTLWRKLYRYLSWSVLSKNARSRDEATDPQYFCLPTVQCCGSGIRIDDPGWKKTRNLDGG